MDTSTHIRMWTLTHTHTNTHNHACTHTCTHTCAHMHTHAHITRTNQPVITSLEPCVSGVVCVLLWVGLVLVWELVPNSPLPGCSARDVPGVTHGREWKDSVHPGANMLFSVLSCKSTRYVWVTVHQTQTYRIHNIHCLQACTAHALSFVDSKQPTKRQLRMQL